MERHDTVWNGMKRSGTVGHGTVTGRSRYGHGMVTVWSRFRLKTKELL
jgi:hypothetical protein